MGSGWPSSEPGLLEPGTLLGEYRVEHVLGSGGMATVYAAVHPVIGKKAAVKVMAPALSCDASAMTRFMIEARAVNRIRHPNIVDVFSFGRLPDGRGYFVMEWLQGETLLERLRREGRIALVDALYLLDQVCDALEAAHQTGVVHRDLKPANLFLCPGKGRRDEVKLLDFGLAKLLHHNQDAGVLVTRPGAGGPISVATAITAAAGALAGGEARGALVGTPEYIAPEQARGEEVTAASDLYSLGVVAYELLLGRPPFLTSNVGDAVLMHLTATPPRPRILWPDIPPLLERLLLGLLAKEAAERPTLGELRLGLKRLRALALLERAMAVRPRRGRWRLVATASTLMALAASGYGPARRALGGGGVRLGALLPRQLGGGAAPAAAGSGEITTHVVDVDTTPVVDTATTPVVAPPPGLPSGLPIDDEVDDADEAPPARAQARGAERGGHHHQGLTVQQRSPARAAAPRPPAPARLPDDATPPSPMTPASAAAPEPAAAPAEPRPATPAAEAPRGGDERNYLLDPFPRR